jgi:hypothetical protein
LLHLGFGKRRARGAISLPNSIFVENKGLARRFLRSDRAPDELRDKPDNAFGCKLLKTKDLKIVSAKF